MSFGLSFRSRKLCFRYFSLFGTDWLTLPSDFKKKIKEIDANLEKLHAYTLELNGFMPVKQLHNEFDHFSGNKQDVKTNYDQNGLLHVKNIKEKEIKERVQTALQLLEKIRVSYYSFEYCRQAVTNFHPDDSFREAGYSIEEEIEPLFRKYEQLFRNLFHVLQLEPFYSTLTGEEKEICSEIKMLVRKNIEFENNLEPVLKEEYQKYQVELAGITSQFLRNLFDPAELKKFKDSSIKEDVILKSELSKVQSQNDKVKFYLCL